MMGDGRDGLAMGCRQRDGEEEVSSDFASVVGSGNWDANLIGGTVGEGSLDVR